VERTKRGEEEKEKMRGEWAGTHEAGGLCAGREGEGRKKKREEKRDMRVRGRGERAGDGKREREKEKERKRKKWEREREKKKWDTCQIFGGWEEIMLSTPIPPCVGTWQIEIPYIFKTPNFNKSLQNPHYIKTLSFNN